MIVMNVYWEIGPRVSQKKKKKKTKGKVDGFHEEWRRRETAVG